MNNAQADTIIKLICHQRFLRDSVVVLAPSPKIRCGSILAGAGTAAVVFSAGPGPSLTLRCRISNEAGDSFLATRVLGTAPR